LSLIAYLLAHWIDQWSLSPVLNWKAASRLALETLLPSMVWLQLLKQIQISADIAAQYHNIRFEIVLKSRLTGLIGKGARSELKLFLL